MEVNVIFGDKAKVDDRNNFRIDFQNEDRIIELLLNRKKDYYVTNAITFMENEKNYSQAIKNLEAIAKKYLDAERLGYIESIIYSSIRLDILLDEQLFEKDSVAFWDYAMQKDDMKKYIKEYRYLNTTTHKIETFKLYDFLKHIRYGVNFNLSNARKWIAAPISNLEFKLVENDTKILVKCTPSLDQTLRYYMYEWANTIMVYDKAKNSWIKSKTWWGGSI